MSYVSLGAALPFPKTQFKAGAVSAAQVPCSVKGLDTFYRHLDSLDNNLVFKRAQVNNNNPTKYKEFFGHSKTVLKDARAETTHWKAIKSALKKAEADNLVPRLMGPYFIPFGLPEQLQDPKFRSKIARIEQVENFFLRISAMSLLKTDKELFEKVLKQRGNQLNLVGGPEYPFGWVGSQLGFETGDWQKLAKAYYDGLTELAKRTCTYAPAQPKPITDAGREFGKWFQREVINKNKTFLSNFLWFLPKDVKDGLLSSDAFGFIWDSISGAESLLVTVIERVRVRSGKNVREIFQIGKPPVKVDMRASYGQPILKTLAQILTLLGTENFATNDEFIRAIFGLPRGRRGPLGYYGGLGAAEIAAGGGVGIGAFFAANGMSIVSGVLGVLGPVVTGIFSTLQANIAADTAKAQMDTDLELAKLRLEETKLKEGTKLKTAEIEATRTPPAPQAQLQSSSNQYLLPGIAVAALAGYLLFAKSKK